MVVNMVERAPNLQEVVYTHVREEVLEDAKQHLAYPWVQWATRRWCSTDSKGPDIRVYVQTVWHRPILSRLGTVQGVEWGNTPGGPTLIFDSGQWR